MMNNVSCNLFGKGQMGSALVGLPHNHNRNHGYGIVYRVASGRAQRLPALHER